jgi:hypothetical protein
VKDVADLARLGFPLAEVDADGSAVITKVAAPGIGPPRASVLGGPAGRRPPDNYEHAPRHRARAGRRQGRHCHISLIAHDARDYPRLLAHATPERVEALFTGIANGQVTRYELPQLGALNFVITGGLGGGVTRSLALDAHGKSLSALLLTMEIPDETDRH